MSLSDDSITEKVASLLSRIRRGTNTFAEFEIFVAKANAFGRVWGGWRYLTDPAPTAKDGCVAIGVIFVASGSRYQVYDHIPQVPVGQKQEFLTAIEGEIRTLDLDAKISKETDRLVVKLTESLSPEEI